MNDELKQQIIEASKRLALEIIKMPEDAVFTVKQLSHDIGYGFNNQELGIIQKLIDKILAKKYIYLHYGENSGKESQNPYELPVQKAHNLAFSLEVPHYNGRLAPGKTVSEKRYFIQKSSVTHLITQRKKFVKPNTGLYAIETIDVPTVYSIDESRDILKILQQLGSVEEYNHRADDLSPRDKLSHTILSSAKRHLVIDNNDPVFQELIYRTFGLADSMLQPTGVTAVEDEMEVA